MDAVSRPESPTASASVQVVVRLRPLNGKEKKHGTLPVISASTNDKTVTVIKGQGSRQIKTSFKFDNVFTAFSTQEEVFEATLQPVIRDVLMGFESTVFAYGQTGTGKTHTMEGDLSDSDLHGVIPRSAAAIFNAVKHSSYLEHSLSCSFLEIYNEDLCDLLVDSGNSENGSNKRVKLGIMEGKNGPFCRGLSETKVTSAEEVITLMRRAQEHRQVGETNMNKQSSRSHCIFTLKVHTKRQVADRSILETSGKLHCVDLAGSECAKSADLEKGTDDHQAARERERMNINRSLLTLGRVVSMLKEQSLAKKSFVRIPYRDSKLTRILQESLGGRCKTCLIATVSPSITAIEESMSTLNYAQAANGIVNKPITSSFMTSQPNTSALNFDKKSSQGSNPDESPMGTVEHWHEMECRLQYMQSQVEEAQQALARKHLQQQELVEKAERAEADRMEAMTLLEQSECENKALHQEIENHLAEKKVLCGKIDELFMTLQRTKVILMATQRTEVALTGEAKSLISVLQKSISDGTFMHAALIQQHEEEKLRKSATEKFLHSFQDLIKDVEVSIGTMHSLQLEFCGSIRNSTDGQSKIQSANIENQRSTLDNISGSLNTALTVLKEQVVGDSGFISSFSMTASDVRGSLNEMSSENASTLRNLRTSSNAIRDRLVDAGAKMKQLEVGYTESTAHMLEQLASSVVQTKDSLSNSISSVLGDLERARRERNACFDSLRTLALTWEGASQESCQTVNTAAIDETSNLQHLIDLLHSEEERHSTISNELLQQRSFLDNQNKSYFNHLEAHTRLLKEQKDMAEASERRGKEICEQAFTNIMSGVQELLKNELASITQHQAANAASVATSSSGLMASNDVTSNSAQVIFNTILKGNQILEGHTKKLHGVGQQSSLVIEKATATFNQIQLNCLEHLKEIGGHGNTMRNIIEKSDENDQKSLAETVQLMEQANKKFSADLVNRILKDTQSNVSHLTMNAKDSFNFVKQDIIDVTQRDIELSVERAVNSLQDRTHSMIQHASEALADGERTINHIAQAQCAQLDGASENLANESEVLRSNLSAQHEAILRECGRIHDVSMKHEQQVVDRHTQCLKAAAHGFQTVQTFANDVIQVDQEATAVSEWAAPKFCDTLTATPSTDVILKDFSSKSSSMIDDQILLHSDNRADHDFSPLETESKPYVLREQTNKNTPQKNGGSGEVHKRRAMDSGGRVIPTGRSKRSRMSR